MLNGVISLYNGYETRTATQGATYVLKRTNHGDCRSKFNGAPLRKRASDLEGVG